MYMNILKQSVSNFITFYVQIYRHTHPPVILNICVCKKNIFIMFLYI